MFKKIIFIFLGISIVFLLGCVKALPPEQTAPQINLSLHNNKISLAVLDKRPYVVNDDKSLAFEGIIRSGYGIPYSYQTPTDQPMSEYLTQRMSIGFENKGIETVTVKTDPKMKINEVITELSSYKNKSILIILNEWKYDYHGFSDGSWYDINVIITGTSGKKLLIKNFKGDNDIPDTGTIIMSASPTAISNELQKIYKQRFEQVFSNIKVIEALASND
jgi:hypothetical protein